MIYDNSRHDNPYVSVNTLIKHCPHNHAGDATLQTKPTTSEYATAAAPDRKLAAEVSLNQSSVPVQRRESQTGMTDSLTSGLEGWTRVDISEARARYQPDNAGEVPVLEEGPIQGKFDPVQNLGNNPQRGTEKPLQRKENSTGMPDSLKTGMENYSGMDLSEVRVHYNSSKPPKVGALAYTQGTDIHVAPGQEKHLPHEAWHVVQQAQGRVRPTIQLKGLGVSVNDDVVLEREADEMAAKTTPLLGKGGQSVSKTSGLKQNLKSQLQSTQPIQGLFVYKNGKKMSENARKEIKEKLKNDIPRLFFFRMYAELSNSIHIFDDLWFMLFRHQSNNITPTLNEIRGIAWDDENKGGEILTEDEQKKLEEWKAARLKTIRENYASTTSSWDTEVNREKIIKSMMEPARKEQNKSEEMEEEEEKKRTQQPQSHLMQSSSAVSITPDDAVNLRLRGQRGDSFLSISSSPVPLASGEVKGESTPASNLQERIIVYLTEMRQQEKKVDLDDLIKEFHIKSKSDKSLAHTLLVNHVKGPQKEDKKRRQEEKKRMVKEEEEKKKNQGKKPKRIEGGVKGLSHKSKPGILYRWCSTAAAKEALKNGIEYDPNGGGIPTLLTSLRDAALQVGAVAVNVCLQINVEDIPDFDWEWVPSRSSLRECKIKCNIPSNAIKRI